MAQPKKVNPEDFDYDVWHVTGGGLARWDSDKSQHVYIELPEEPDGTTTYTLGEAIPGSASLTAANAAARRKILSIANNEPI